MLESDRPISENYSARAWLASIDLFDVARKLFAWQTIAIVTIGCLFGLAAPKIIGEIYSQSVAIELRPIALPCARPLLDNRSLKSNEFEKETNIKLSGAVLSGYPVWESKIPPSLRDYFATLSFGQAQSSTGQAVLSVEGPSSKEVENLLRLAIEQIQQPSSPVTRALALARTARYCGFEFSPWAFEENDVNPNDVGKLDATAVVSTSPKGVESRPRIKAIFGLLIGILCSLMIALWCAAFRSYRSQTKKEKNNTPPEFPSSHSGTKLLSFADKSAFVTLAGLLLATAMDTVMVANLGSFTLRFGHICALVVALSTFGKYLIQKRQFNIPTGVFAACLAYFSLIAFSAFCSLNPLKSLGYFAWGSFDVVIVLLGLAGYISNLSRLRKALKLWACGMLIATGMGAVQILSWLLGYKPPLFYSDGTGFPRINGFSYEPSYFALYLVPGALVFLTRFVFLGRSAWRSAALSGILFLAIALSTSRSGWIACTAGIIILFVWAFRSVGSKGAKRLAAASGGIALALTLVMASWPSMRQRAWIYAHKAIEPNEITSSRPRLEGLRQAAVLIQRKPLLGVGFGGYGAYVISHPELPQLGSGADSHSLVTSNLFLEIAAETGVIGLGAALVMLASLLLPLLTSRSARPKSADCLAESRELQALQVGFALASVVVFGIMFQFNQTLWRLDTWVLIALSFATLRVGRIEKAAKTSAEQNV